MGGHCWEGHMWQGWHGVGGNHGVSARPPRGTHILGAAARCYVAWQQDVSRVELLVAFPSCAASESCRIDLSLTRHAEHALQFTALHLSMGCGVTSEEHSSLRAMCNTFGLLHQSRCIGRCRTGLTISYIFLGATWKSASRTAGKLFHTLPRGLSQGVG